MESGNKNPRGHGRSDSNRDEPSTSSGKRKTSESDVRGSDTPKKLAPERREIRSKNRIISIIRTRPHDLRRESTYDRNFKSYSEVERIHLEVNFFRLAKRIPAWNIHQYHVEYQPDPPLARTRRFLVNQHKDVLDPFLFDGTQLLFTSRRIQTEGDELELRSMDDHDNTMYKIRLKFTAIVQPNDEHCLQIYNLIIRKGLAALHLQLVGRHFYDPGNMINLAQHRIQLWPGYETSIREYTGGLLLNCDVAHKVMRTDRVYDMLKTVLKSDRNNFQKNFQSQIIGKTVLTAYNNKTYRIDDVDFTKKPSDTFRKGDQDLTFVQYFAERYQQNITDGEQPLLVVNPSARDRRGGRDQPVLLVPELCRLTGMDDRQRNDMSLKTALKPYTQMNPRIRRERLLQFNRRMYQTERSTQVMNEWNLELERDLVRIENAYKLPPRPIKFGGGDVQKVSASWDNAFKGNIKLYETIELMRLAVVHPGNLQRDTESFLHKLQALSRKMGFYIGKPLVYEVATERNMIGKIDEVVGKNAQMIIFITSQDSRKNADWYGSIKIKSAKEGIPTQVVTKRVLTSPDGRLASIVTKIAIQMNCKLGGLPWMPNIPLSGVMSVGFEIAKDSSNGKRYGCLVATMDLKQPTRSLEDASDRQIRFFSKVEEINGSDCSLQLTSCITLALEAYLKEHKALPDRIIFYRGGCGDGDLSYIKDTEVSILKKRLADRYKGANRPLKLIYMVVTKKINTRFFLRNSNDHVNAGTVVDNTITLDERYEFYMVSQVITQGTATPTNYSVIHESEEFALEPEKLQIWTWIQTHLYYNWCGTTRVPAVLQYAIKLGFLVSNYMHRTPENRMNNQLYFL